MPLWKSVNADSSSWQSGCRDRCPPRMGPLRHAREVSRGASRALGAFDHLQDVLLSGVSGLLQIPAISGSCTPHVIHGGGLRNRRPESRRKPGAPKGPPGRARWWSRAFRWLTRQCHTFRLFSEIRLNRIQYRRSASVFRAGELCGGRYAGCDHLAGPAIATSCDFQASERQLGDIGADAGQRNIPCEVPVDGVPDQMLQLKKLTRPELFSTVVRVFGG